MEEFLNGDLAGAVINIAIWVVVSWGIGYFIKHNTPEKGHDSSGEKQNTPVPIMKQESSAMPHKHRRAGVYDSYNKKTKNNDSGTMPHKHENNHYTSMADASKLPQGYILLNGEPVRVADLEGK